MASTFSWPLSRLGVPTQIRARSDSRTASSVEVVPRSWPRATTSASRSPSPDSTRGEPPALTMATLSALMSTPVTWWPARARDAAVPHPTYPRPNTLTRMVRDRLLAVVLEFSRDVGPGVALLDEPAPAHAQGAAALRVPAQGDDGLSEVRRGVDLEEMLPGLDGKALGTDPPGHDSLGQRHGLE